MFATLIIYVQVVWFCAEIQAVSIFCTVSCTTSSFKGTTFSVRIGVAPGGYLYFVFLGERRKIILHFLHRETIVRRIHVIQIHTFPLCSCIIRVDTNVLL